MKDLTHTSGARHTVPFDLGESILEGYGLGDETFRAAAIQTLPQLHSHARGATTDPSEAQFIDAWTHKFNLDTARWGEFLTAWGRAVEAFQTPLSFLDSLVTTKISLTVEGRSYDANRVSFEDRNTLVSDYTQRYRIQASRGDYGPGRFLVPESCVLCECVAKAEDDKGLGEVGNSVTLMEHGDFSLMANRFPWEPGNLLLMPFSHDHQGESPLLTSHRPQTRIHESGMAWGTPSTHYLEAMFRVADLFDFVAIRNHPETGMSQPQHDHAHCFPSDLPKGLIPRRLASELRETGRIADDIVSFESPHSPFSVYTLASNERSRLARAGSTLLYNLERSGHAAVCSYYDGVLSVGVLSPKGIRPAHPARFGARMLLNYFTPSELENFDQTCRYFPMAGEFDWKKYL
jgi:hypothetical protein